MFAPPELNKTSENSPPTGNPMIATFIRANSWDCYRAMKIRLKERPLPYASLIAASIMGRHFCHVREEHGDWRGNIVSFAP
jgi:hypothetical protein